MDDHHDISHLEQGFEEVPVVENWVSMRRKFLYDIWPEHMLEQGFKDLKINPGSVEGIRAEMEAAAQRDSNFSVILHHVALFLGGIAGEVLSRAQIAGAREAGTMHLSDAEVEQFVLRLATVSQAIAAVVVMEMLDLGIISDNNMGYIRPEDVGLTDPTIETGD